MTEVLMETNFSDLKLFKQGKVRDTYDLGDHLLMIATDRISTFDCVHPTGIPDKGKILTALSIFWFDITKDECPNHFVCRKVDEYLRLFQNPPKGLAEKLASYTEILKGRSMFIRKVKVIPVECIVRGYLYGSGWGEYQKTGTVCGIKLPSGLKEADKLPKPIFTPSTKASTGHDRNITFEEMEEIIGKEAAKRIREISLAIYQKAAYFAYQRGIIIADTKFEFGRCDNILMIIDELLTPDSSRFWPVDQYKPGGKQPSFDKQFVRDHVSSIGWNKEPPAPELPDDIVQKTREKYIEAYKRLTGRKFE